MSDLEKRIQERASLQAQHDIDETARLALETERRRAEESAVLERSLRLGKEVVDLLRKYDLPSKIIWELKFLGEDYFTVPPKSYYQYIDAGPGWHIYTHQTGDPNNTYDHPIREKYIGLSEAGSVFEFEGHSSEDTRRQLKKPQRVEGLLIPTYHHPLSAIPEIEGEKFQEGVASLIRGEGPRKIVTPPYS